jgi:hypothetical protein
MTVQALHVGANKTDAPVGLQSALSSNAELQKPLSQKVVILICAV